MHLFIRIIIIIINTVNYDGEIYALLSFFPLRVSASCRFEGGGSE